ncbi:MAG: glutamate--tRNA ligase [Thermoplasmata archaeon]
MALSSQVLDRMRRAALENSIAHADAPRPGPVVARILSSDAALRPLANEVRAEAERLVAEIAGLSPEARAMELERLGGPEPETRSSASSSRAEMPELPGAVAGSVVLRMAPFPSGTLHIGNARMLYVNQFYREKYRGRLLFVFDDTIGSEEKRSEPELFDLILGDLELAGVKPDAVYYKSDRIPSFYPWARRVIEAGGAYVCHCPAETLRENRARGVACPERSQTVVETLEGWERMLGGSYAVGAAVLRLRADIRDPDPAFRDRVLFRLSDVDHPRVGRRYRVWPMLEFSWAVDDIELGITHVLRGKDLVIEDRMQEHLWKLLGIHGPPFIHWGLLRVREAKISKSKSYTEVKSGLYDGWDDPRTWSLRSLDRRGITMAALREFTLSFGLSLSDIEVPAETLYAENRQLIDATTERRSFIADAQRVDVGGWPGGIDRVDLANHPDHPELGVRSVGTGPSFFLSRADLVGHAGEEVRLKDLANIQLPEHVPLDGGAVPAIFTSRENKRVPRFQWVSVAEAIPVDLLRNDGTHVSGIGERSIAFAPERARFQFERVGFVRLDRGWSKGEQPVRAVFGHP